MLGLFTLLVTIEVAILTHPFAGLVAVSVNVPATVTQAGLGALFKLPPFHTIVLPALMPDKVTVALIHVTGPLLDAEIFGATVFCVTVLVCVFEQPFTGSVT